MPPAIDGVGKYAIIKLMSESSGNSGNRMKADIIRFQEYKKRKSERDARRTMGVHEKYPEKTGETLTEAKVLEKTKEIAARFPSIESLAYDIDRQQMENVRDANRRFNANLSPVMPNHHENSQRALKDYIRELKDAGDMSPDEVRSVVCEMFAGYDPAQLVSINSKYVAYAREYLKKCHPEYRLPEME